MPKYTIQFNGRTRGAIGIFYPCEVIVTAETEDEALLKLYDTHDHCMFIHIVKIETE